MNSGHNLLCDFTCVTPIFGIVFIVDKKFNLILEGTFTCLAAVFRLRRNPGFLFFSTYVPSVLIVIMSWISFWIPPESTPARFDSLFGLTEFCIGTIYKSGLIDCVCSVGHVGKVLHATHAARTVSRAIALL